MLIHLLVIKEKKINGIVHLIILKLGPIGLELLHMGIVLKNLNKMITQQNIKSPKNYKPIQISFINMVIHYLTIETMYKNDFVTHPSKVCPAKLKL
jgi:hypothetical protein